jgi:hypothetical protein
MKEQTSDDALPETRRDAFTKERCSWPRRRHGLTLRAVWDDGIHSQGGKQKTMHEVGRIVGQMRQAHIGDPRTDVALVDLLSGLT